MTIDNLHSSTGEPTAAEAAWTRCLQEAKRLAGTTLREQFAADPARAGRYTLTAAGLTLDFSKNRVDEAALDGLLALAAAAGLPSAIAALFAGAKVNNTEERPALHTLLRAPRGSDPRSQAVYDTLARMEAFCAALAQGHWLGFRGERITDVVNIGIGGSDLGPAMVYEALQDRWIDGLRCHFVSNVDPLHLEQTLARLQPGTTLFVIASKTFTTLETMQNARAARAWALAAGLAHSDLAKHFVAVSANVEKAAEFGIAPVNIFPLWDWVGGRYSLWSAIGLPIALGVGMANFRALLAGAHALDEHFRTAPLRANLPVLLGLLTHWYYHAFGAHSHAVLPYAQNLQWFPAFLQQLDMESLGKQVSRDGLTLRGDSGGILWGSAGTNGQHSFHQLLHQGTRLVPADFIAVLQSRSSQRDAHLQLLANCFAQSQALMLGKSREEAHEELLRQGMGVEQANRLAPHKACPGNRPTNTILLSRLDPGSLGALIALYEHKVYVQSVLLGLNAFDQWGVELGKVLGNGVYRALTAGEPCQGFDSSTAALIERVRLGQ